MLLWSNIEANVHQNHVCVGHKRHERAAVKLRVKWRETTHAPKPALNRSRASEPSVCRSQKINNRSCIQLFKSVKMCAFFLYLERMFALRGSRRYSTISQVRSSEKNVSAVQLIPKRRKRGSKWECNRLPQKSLSLLVRL